VSLTGARGSLIERYGSVEVFRLAWDLLEGSRGHHAEGGSSRTRGHPGGGRMDIPAVMCPPPVANAPWTSPIPR